MTASAPNPVIRNGYGATFCLWIYPNKTLLFLPKQKSYPWFWGWGYCCGMEFETGQELQNARAAQPGIPRDVPPNVSQGISDFLAWFMLWLRLCVERAHSRSGQASARVYEPNRFWRRRGQRDIIPARDNRPYYSFVRPGLSPTQFMEWLAQMSGRGRVRVYRMRYWRKTVKGKAAPLGTEHEYWRDPLGRIGKRMGKLPTSFWYAHLWPGWRLSFSN